MTKIKIKIKRKVQKKGHLKTILMTPGMSKNKTKMLSIYFNEVSYKFVVGYIFSF